ncbi:MAG TPA: serine hydrolase domain-containing protein [Chitinophagaceae bacterium]|nr:serine hydrolase domain-containing protein [Chitinophagaceae bacterium]
MKTIVCVFVLMITGCSCNDSSGNSVPRTAVIKEDSLDYYPPTPGKITRDEFRYYYRELARYFDSTLLKKGFNGGILIAKDGNIIYEQYAGYADIRSRTPMTDSTMMHIASSGKTFTGMAILRLAQENLLSLDDQLEKFFPEFPYPGVTVKMLLSHRSGLPNYVYFLPAGKWDKKKFATNEDVLNTLYTDKPTRLFKPGTRFTYSNTNFVLLALIIEKISGLSFPEFMRSKFFEPLGMNHTYVFTMKDSATATQSYQANGALWQYDCLEGTYGDKNIYTTPGDLLKWDQAFYTEQIINKTMQDSAYTPYSLERPSIHNYGLGWRLLMLPNGKKVIYHNGRWHGFNAAFARLTDEKATIIILGNRYNSRIYTAARHAYDIFGNYLQTHDGDQEENDSNEPVVRKVSHHKSSKHHTRKVRRKR